MNIPHVRTVEHAEAPVRVWHEQSTPDAPGAPLPAMVALYVGYPGRDDDHPVFIPVETARQVAAAILETIPE